MVVVGGGRIQKLCTVLTENKSDAHLFNSAHTPLKRTNHMVPNHCKRGWEMWSLVEQLLPLTSSTLWKGRINFIDQLAISVAVLGSLGDLGGGLFFAIIYFPPL